MTLKKTAIRIMALLCAFCLCFSLCACGPGNNTDELQESETTAPTTVETTTAAPKKTDYNRLTGLDNLSKAAKGKRPVAIMINNIRQSLPQYGILNADLMFECLVEGGITRMMAVFADYTKIPEVCSVRSCRYYFPYFAFGLDAVYICFGCNPTFGQRALDTTGIDYFDGSKNYDTTLFGRDPARLGKYAKELTEGKKKTTDIDEEYKKDFEKEKSDSVSDTADLSKSSLPEKLQEAIKALGSKKADVKEIDGVYYLIYKGDINEKAAKIKSTEDKDSSDSEQDTDAVSRETVLRAMKDDDYKSYLEEECKKLKYDTNDACLSKYTVERTVDIVKNEEAKQASA